MITFRQKGDFSKLTRFLERAKETVHLGDLDQYGRAGVAALASATPVDSGETAQSWYYEITNKKGFVSISFHNSNIQNGVPIAIILQYPSDFTIPTASGLEWALFPSAANGSQTTYVPDVWVFNGSYPCLYHGGYYSQYQDHGPFCVYYDSTSYSSGSVGCRLQERPPKAA